MKKTVVFFCLMGLVLTSQAQVIVEENYIIDLIANATVECCSQDTLENGEIIKNMSLHFQDTSVFYKAYLCSIAFTTEVVECDFVVFDDKLSLTYEELQEFFVIKHKLDTLLQFTPLIPCDKKFWWESEW